MTSRFVAQPGDFTPVEPGAPPPDQYVTPSRFSVHDGELTMVEPGAPMPPSPIKEPKLTRVRSVWFDAEGTPTTKDKAIAGEVTYVDEAGAETRVYVTTAQDDTMSGLAAGGAMATVEQPVEDPAVETGPAWTSVFAVEGVDTSDERRLAEGSVEWRDMPLTLMAQTVTDIGHDGAQVAGRIDEIHRDGNQILASGVFSNDEHGQQIAKWVGDGTLRGVSIDLAADEWEIEPYPEEEGATDDADLDLIDLFGPAGIMVVTKGTILGATITPFPAFAEATIMLASGEYDGKRRRVLRINSSIQLAFPQKATPPAPADGATDSSTVDNIVADCTEVANDYPGVSGSITVTVDGNDTNVKFPPAGATDPDQAEDAATASGELERGFAQIGVIIESMRRHLS